MDLGLEGRVALVTGSYRGTGAGIARMLAAEGATVLVHGLDPGQADETASSIVAAGGACHAVVGDIRTEAGTESLVAAVRAVVDRVDIVINNYGVAEGSDWDTSDTASWHGSYDTNVVTAVRVTQAFLPDMRAAGFGSGRVRVDGRRHPTRRPDPRVLHREGRAAVAGGEPGQAPRGYGHHGELREPGHHRHRRGRRALHRAGPARGPGHRLADGGAPDPRGPDGATRRAGWRRPTTSAGSSPSW